MKRMWTYPLISAVIFASAFACDGSEEEGASSASENGLQAAPAPQQAMQKPEVVADEERDSDEQDASAQAPDVTTEKATHGRPRGKANGAKAPSQRRQPTAGNSPKSAADPASDPKNRNARKPGSWKEKLEPPDPESLTPEQREDWRVIQHIHENYDYEDIRRAGKESRQRIDEMREARKRGEGGSRMGALVAPADSDTNESSDGSN